MFSFVISSIPLYGTTKIKNIAEFKSLNETDGRIALFYLDKGGKLYLNSESKPKQIDGIEVCFFIQISFSLKKNQEQAYYKIYI
jgi:hypothetical protein